MPRTGGVYSPPALSGLPVAPIFGLSIGCASVAASRAIRLDIGIIWCELMAIYAMRFCALSGYSDSLGFPYISASRLSGFFRRSTILGVFRRRYPSAILRAIISCAVNAVNLHSFRARAHVEKESLKRPAPSRTDGNAFTTIVRIVHVIRVVATRQHRIVRDVSAGVRWIGIWHLTILSGDK